MKIRTKRPLLLAGRAQRFVRWSRRLLFITGTLALGYVGFTLIDATFYQVSAKRSLENQIQIMKEHKVGQPKPTVKKGDILGRIDVPRLGMSVAVLQGTSSRMLRLGAGHIEGTPFPWESGNSGIAGHRDTFFRRLKDLRRNDEIQLQTATGLLLYEVEWMRVIEPEDVTILAPATESTLTLVTCYPFYFVGPAPKRFVVRAHKHEPPADPGLVSTFEQN
jgi:sortase A